MVALESFLQALSAGLLIGCAYGLMCVALGLIFGVMRLVNFAQGDFLMLGMYFALFVVTGTGLDTAIGPTGGVLLTGVIAVAPFLVFGWLIHQVLVGPVSGMEKSLLEEERHQAQLIMTLGISLVLANGGLMVFGSTPMALKTPLSSEAWELGPLVGDEVLVFLNKAQVLTASIALLAAGGLYVLLHATSLGKRIRAAADNPTAAIYMGVDVARSHRVAFGIGIALTAVAGVMVAMFYPFHPYVGLDFVVIMYAGVVLGGLGSVMGSFWGGVVIGLVQQLSTLVLPVQLQGTAVFVVFLLTMLIRPQGLFGRNVERA
jgi:branched-chain amino acid transport system permease protein